MPFIMSKLISVHDGDMLVGVLNKNMFRKMHEVLFRKERMCATPVSTSGVAFLRLTVTLAGTVGYIVCIGLVICLTKCFILNNGKPWLHKDLINKCVKLLT